MNTLIPNNLYLLKWSSIRQNGKIDNIVVLKGQFITYFNDIHCESFVNFTDPPPETDVTMIYTDTTSTGFVKYPFDHPLYPYSRFYEKGVFSCNLGLFRIISVDKIKRPIKNNNPYSFEPLMSNTLINTPPQLIYGETLMWVDLNHVVIRPAINRLKLVQEKALTKLPDELINYGVRPFVGPSVGGKKKKTTRKKKKQNKSKRCGFTPSRV